MQTAFERFKRWKAAGERATGIFHKTDAIATRYGLSLEEVATGRFLEGAAARGDQDATDLLRLFATTDDEAGKPNEDEENEWFALLAILTVGDLDDDTQGRFDRMCRALFGMSGATVKQLLSEAT